MLSETKEKKGGGEVKENISNNVKPPRHKHVILLIDPKLCSSTNYVGTYFSPT
jgi:hypothetical protein